MNGHLGKMWLPGGGLGASDMLNGSSGNPEEGEEDREDGTVQGSHWRDIFNGASLSQDNHPAGDGNASAPIKSCPPSHTNVSGKAAALNPTECLFDNCPENEMI